MELEQLLSNGKLKRTEVVCTRLSEAERRALEEEAREREIKVSDWVRRKILINISPEAEE